MGQVNNSLSRTESEQSSNQNRKLHITFHNPNTADETAKYLVKAIVKDLVKKEED